jgi:hypothetical protein
MSRSGPRSTRSCPRHPGRRPLPRRGRGDPGHRPLRSPCPEHHSGPPRPPTRPAVPWPQAVEHGRGASRRPSTPCGGPEVAARWLNALIDVCRAGHGPEERGMARTLGRWRAQILAWHSTGASNGPTEDLNSLIKKVKRIAPGSGTSPTTGSASSSTPAAATGHHSAPDPRPFAKRHQTCRWTLPFGRPNCPDHQ